MPPKKVLCQICGVDVLKSQTVFIGNGKRACKEHPEAVKISSELQENMRKEKDREMKQAQEKKQCTNSYQQAAFTSVARVVCWCCGKKGIEERDFYLRCLINSEKLQITKDYETGLDIITKPQRMTMEDLKKENLTVLFLFPFATPRLEDIKSKLLKDFRELSFFLRVVNLCPECVKELKLEADLEKYKEDAIKPTLTQLHNMGTIYEIGLKETVKGIALQELNEEKQKGQT